MAGRGLSVSVASGSYAFVAVQSSHCCGFCCRSRALGTQASVVVAHEPSCFVVFRILLDQRLNPCPLYWQADLGSSRKFI